jgi:hypothetical protein
MPDASQLARAPEWQATAPKRVAREAQHGVQPMI